MLMSVLIKAAKMGEKNKNKSKGMVNHFGSGVFSMYEWEYKDRRLKCVCRMLKEQQVSEDGRDVKVNGDFYSAIIQDISSWMLLNFMVLALGEMEWLFV